MENNKWEEKLKVIIKKLFNFCEDLGSDYFNPSYFSELLTQYESCIKEKTIEEQSTQLAEKIEGIESIEGKCGTLVYKGDVLNLIKNK